ncbi:hypothetical protein [Erwinia phage FBB1]|nr:hypothetical protein [Erwinia phage FBB1]
MKFKMMILALILASSSAMAYDEIKCIKYMEGDQALVEKMIKTDLEKAAKTPSEKKTVKGLKTDTIIAAGYVMYCVKDDIDMMEEVGAE